MENESCFPLNPVLVLKIHDDSSREQMLTCSTPSQTTSNPRTLPKADWWGNKQGFVHHSIMDKLEFKGDESFHMIETFFFNIYIVLPSTELLLQNLLVYKTTLLWILPTSDYFSFPPILPTDHGLTQHLRGAMIWWRESKPRKRFSGELRVLSGHDAGEWSGFLTRKCDYASLADWTCALLGCNEYRGISWAQMYHHSLGYYGDLFLICLASRLRDWGS